MAAFMSARQAAKVCGVSEKAVRRWIAAGRVHTLRYRAGETVVRQGDSADRFYIIKHGRVTVSHRDEDGREAVLATLGPGQFFGEMGLLTDAPRMASVHAETDLEVLTLDREAFRGLLEPAGGAAPSASPPAGPSPEDRPEAGGAFVGGRLGGRGPLGLPHPGPGPRGDPLDRPDGGTVGAGRPRAPASAHRPGPPDRDGVRHRHTPLGLG